MLARLLTRSPTSDPDAIRCASRLPTTLVRFAYQDHRYVDVTLDDSFGACAQLAFVAGRPYRVPHDLAEFIAYPGGPAPRARTVPDLHGLPVSDAAAAARTAGFRLQLDGMIRDPLSKPWTVLLQSHGGGKEVDVLAVAPPPSADCRIAQLRAQYRPAGEVHSWEDIGFAVLRNVSDTWCTLRGAIRVVGLDADDQAVTPVVTVRLPQPAALSPDAPAVPAHRAVPSAERVVGLQFDAAFADPATIVCASELVVPETWRVSFSGGSLTLPNAEGRVGRRPGDDGLVTCGGPFSFGVDLSQ